MEMETGIVIETLQEKTTNTKKMKSENTRMEHNLLCGPSRGKNDIF